MAEGKQVKYDTDGYEVLTTAIRALINQYPGLDEGEEFAFSILSEESGKAMFPKSGAVVETEKTNIIGHVTQNCLYPFYVVCRVAGLSEDKKAEKKEWMDSLGKWLEKQEIDIDGTKHRLTEYPPLTGDREFLSIYRESPAYLNGTNENKSEDWAVLISAKYRNEYDT